MPVTSRHCSGCGHPLEARTVDDRVREVCPRCGTVCYRNPLPVAATLVLNERREVLLVKRRHDPYRGRWCLPIGFAELDETIAEAALRELEEETGVRGRVVRLLDASSTVSDLYGDLLIVTFEVEKQGGSERAGDDADAVAYFPLAELPPLAFRPNETAIRACIDAHRDGWAIQDSFRHLQEDGPDAMLSDSLVALVRDHAREVAERWLGDVRTHPTTGSYARLDTDRLRERAATALLQFTRWLAGHGADAEAQGFYRALGAERRGQGVGLHEVLSSLTLLRRHVWAFARDQGVWSRPIDEYRVLELDRRVVAFFDRAMYEAALGYAGGAPGESGPV